MDTTTVINVSKGEKIDLTKTNPGLEKLAVGLGWKEQDVTSGPTFDLDAFALILNSSGKVLNGYPEGFCYFNHKSAFDGAVSSRGDNLTGAGDGDDETIDIILSKLPAEAEEVLIYVNIFEAASKNQNFGQVEDSYIRLYNASTDTELMKYDLNEDYSSFTGVNMGKIYRKDGEWKFAAIGKGVNGSVAEIAKAYL